MNEALKTYERFGGGQLALMAVELSRARTSFRTMVPGMGDHPLPRVYADRGTATGEYYGIIDRIARGEQP